MLAQAAPDAGGARKGPPASSAAMPGLPAASLPPRPTELVAAKAYVALDVSCARCHQSGRAAADFPMSALGNILDLEAVARMPNLVRPGNPDASMLYQRMFEHPAVAEAGEQQTAVRPAVAEIEAVREWIEALPSKRTTKAGGSACAPRPGTGSAELATAMRRWLDQIGAAAARDTRFLSVAHLQRNCAPDGEIAIWRQAAAQALNSLSWSEKPARLEAVGDALVLFAVRLKDLGWRASHWEKLVAGYPASGRDAISRPVAAATGAKVPLVAADWLASAALRAPLYYDLLGLPPTLAGLDAMLGSSNAPAAMAHKGGEGSARIALAQSAETAAPRLVERRLAKGRPVWLAHDFAPDGETSTHLARLIASLETTAVDETVLKRVGSRVLFTLPNGFPAFAAYGPDGRRLDTAHPAAAHPWPENGSGAALGCRSCHGMGALPAIDQGRAHVESEAFAADAAVRAAAAKLYPPADVVARLFEADRSAARGAVARAGLDPDILPSGLDPVVALARLYDLDVDLGRAAAEFGLDRTAFAERLRSFDGAEADQALALRLTQGTLLRSEAERLYVALRGGARRAASPPFTGEQERMPLALWTDHVVYKSGALVTVHAVAAADCYLTLASVEPGGGATVLFPNDFEQDNLLRGGRRLRVPSPEAGYQLRLREKGTETLVARCDPHAKVPPGIEHDFERQRFTVLGNWRNFLRRRAELAAERGAPRPAAGPVRQSPRGRNGEAAAETDNRKTPPAYSAIQIVVE